MRKQKPNGGNIALNRAATAPALSTNPRPLVLIVEDDHAWHQRFVHSLSEYADIIFADSANEAERLIDDEHGSISLMAVDGILRGAGTGEDVIFYAKRKGVTCPIVAISSAFNVNLLLAGATHESEKKHCCQLIANLIVR